MKIILASASPRRRELLQQIGWEFEVKVSQVEEKITKTLPYEVVEELSGQKAEDVFERVLAEEARLEGVQFKSVPEEGNAGSPVLQPDGSGEILVIGADTIVACDGQILGKPEDEEDAVHMLQMLQGRSHHVYTGVTICRRLSGGEIETKTFHEKTEVFFYPMTEDEIRDYVSTKEPMDKAGSYAIQGLCAKYIRGINGDYGNVVGLPVGRLYQEVYK